MKGIPVRLPGLRPSAETIERVVHQHGQKIYNLALRMTGSHADAEDVTQEVFVKLFRNWLGLCSRQSLSAWIYRVVTTTCIDLIRDRKARAGRELAVENLETAATDAFDPSGAVQCKELGRKLDAAIQELTPPQVACLILFDHEGLSGKEIGEILGLDENSVRAHVFKARRKVRERLRPYLTESGR
jgi:RNA polymerase sigma-70 factor (ECF subfamily)